MISAKAKTSAKHRELPITIYKGTLMRAPRDVNQFLSNKKLIIPLVRV
jgi:hypothetical protein